jgi:hypothetical protein
LLDGDLCSFVIQTDSDFCSSPNPQAACQQGLGSCQVIPAPSCAGGSSNARSIADHQVSNLRQRQCNRITPAQINTQGLTHLNLAFESINPSPFVVVPGDAADVAIYSQFNAFKSPTLQTWIAIGGWVFQRSWSDSDHLERYGCHLKKSSCFNFLSSRLYGAVRIPRRRLRLGIVSCPLLARPISPRSTIGRYHYGMTRSTRTKSSWVWHTMAEVTR